MDIKESHARINENGRLVIPASFRRALGIAAGDTVVLRLDNDELTITTLRSRLKRAQQIVRKHVPRSVSLVDELIAERREAARRE
jgi:AbrB family looped-hinge helix DNA binding protein